MPTLKLSKKTGLPVGSGLYWNNGKITAKVYINGRPRHIPTRTTKYTKALRIRDVEKTKLIRKARQGDPKRGNVRIDELFEDYLTHLEAQAAKRGTYAPDTAKFTRNSWDANMKKTFGPIRASKLIENKTLLTAYCLRRANEGVTANTYANHELGYLRAALNLAVANGKLDRSMVPSFKMICKRDAKVGRRNSSFTPAQIQAVLNFSPEWLKVLFATCVTTGIRKKESRFVRRANTDWKNLRITLNAAETKAGIERKVPIVDEVLGSLLAWEERTEREHPNCPFLFHIDGRQIKTYQINDAFDNALLKAGLASFGTDEHGHTMSAEKSHKPFLVRSVRWHDGRRYAVTCMGNLDGVNDVDRGRVAGQTEETLKDYDQNVSVEKIRIAMNKKLKSDSGSVITAPRVLAEANKSVNTRSTVASEIRELNELYKEGVLDADEFRAAKLMLISTRQPLVN